MLSLAKFVMSLSILAVATTSVAAKTLPYELDCEINKASDQIQLVDQLRIELRGSSGSCHISTTQGLGSPLLNFAAPGIQVSPPVDLSRWGQRSVVVQVDTDPYKVFVLSTGKNASILATFQNPYGFWMQNGCSDGLWHIWTADGAFQGDPRLTDISHYDLIVPEVAIGWREQQAVDATSTCRAAVEGRIMADRARFSRRAIEDFRNGRVNDRFSEGLIRGNVLDIALKYLYAGRIVDAHKALQQMWPANDEEQVWQWMQQKRSSGFLLQLSNKEAGVGGG
jgi:hypothetical protein